MSRQYLFTKINIQEEQVWEESRNFPVEWPVVKKQVGSSVKRARPNMLKTIKGNS